MFDYTPLNYEQINVQSCGYQPSMVKSYNNAAFQYWCRSLFQRSLSAFEFALPREWKGNIKQFLFYSLYRYGTVAVFNSPEFGLSFQPCGLSGFDFYYQPTKAIVSNPMLSKEFTIHEDCELLQLTPDYRGIWDIISYYAEKLAVMSSSIDVSLINSKVAYILAGRNQAAVRSLKSMMDKINRGEPSVYMDSRLQNDAKDKDVPWQFLERKSVKDSYIVPDLLRDWQTLINAFDAEIGIPTIPYQKAERMVTSEADSKVIDSQARITVWSECFNDSAENVNSMFGTHIKCKLRYKQEDQQPMEEGVKDE